MTPTIGRIVRYTLSEGDAARIDAETPQLPDGALSTHRNSVRAGDRYPAMVVRVFDGTDYCNLQVFLDGNSSYWATSRSEGDQPGTWSWPVIPTAKPVAGGQVHVDVVPDVSGFTDAMLDKLAERLAARALPATRTDC